MLRPQDALRLLIEGNDRYLTRRRERRSSTKRIQPAETACAAVLCCNDMRPSPAVLFNVGMGAIYEVRSSGAAADDAALRRMDFAASVLRTRLFVVLAHPGCREREAVGLPEGEEGAMRRAIEVSTALTRTSTLAPLIERGAVLVVAALLDPVTGVVRFHCGPALAGARIAV